jgi:hypothetical protein
MLKFFVQVGVWATVAGYVDVFVAEIVSDRSPLLQEIVDCLFSGYYFSACVNMHSTELHGDISISYIIHKLCQRQREEICSSHLTYICLQTTLRWHRVALNHVLYIIKY